MMTFLNHNVGDTRFVLPVCLYLQTRIPDGQQLSSHHSLKLSLTDTISEHYQSAWFLLCLSVELLQEANDDVLHVLDHFLVLIRLLDSDLHLILHLSSRIN